jgi:TP901-1 family phage major tail protein|tara:strand:+ start:74 stop:499 length:426 start_codon:yes stop_codon:yes gene_type:complete
MAKQLGRAMLIKIGDGADPEVFSNLCGLNSKTLSVNNTSIDVTTPDCTTPEGALWTQTLAGLKNISVSGDGFFEDSVAEARAVSIANGADNAVNLQIVIPDLGTYSGAFRLATLEYGGETEGGVTYSVSLESNGAITYAAA